MTQPPGANVTGGLFAALIVIFIYGFFAGLPAFGWVILVAAFIGLWVATAKKRTAEEALPDRPWRDDRTDEK